MENITELIKTIQEGLYGWVVLITAIIAIAVVAFAFVKTLEKGTQTLGIRIVESIDNNVNKKSEIRLKELEVRLKELEIQKAFTPQIAENISTYNKSISKHGGGHKVTATKVKHRRPRNEEFAVNKKKDEKTIQTALPKRLYGGLSRR